MTSTHSVPMPPPELRALVGPAYTEDHFDNPTGTPILAEYGLNLETYNTVFDFGCGCGRLARQLMQQDPKPSRYVGVDVHKGMIEWCTRHLTGTDPTFQFFHQDVYSPTYAPGNSLQLALPFPMRDGECSLIIATSVFTHLSKTQTEYYLSEVSRILSREGVAFTSWLFFDRATFPFLPEVYSLYTSETDFTQAVLFDREWFLATVKNLGLGVQRALPPVVAGHQWVVFLTKRTPGMVDRFPLGAEEAEWVSGATMKPAATATLPREILEKMGASPTLQVGTRNPGPPHLFGPLAELDEIKRSRSWKVAQALKGVAGLVRRAARMARP